MDYSKIYRKGDVMASVKTKERKKSSIDNKQEKNIKIYEKYTCFAVGVIIVVLMFAVLKNSIFIPALLITVGLELFTIAYYYMDNKNKKSLVYILFTSGVSLVVIAIIYTIIKLI